MPPRIRPAVTPGPDLDAVYALLREAELPIPDPAEEPVGFLVAEIGGRISACVGWELYGDEALVRSVAVRRGARRQGVGRALVERACADLQARGIRRWTLVTLSAWTFFESLGFRKIPRDEVPDPVRRSPEYSMHSCCVGGTWMTRSIAPQAESASAAPATGGLSPAPGTV